MSRSASRFLELGVSMTAIAKITGVSRTALYSFMSGMSTATFSVVVTGWCRAASRPYTT